MPEAIGTLSGIFWVLFFMVWMVAGPAVIVYVSWRVLHDLRRIADAAEYRNLSYRDMPPAVPPERITAPSAPTGAISLSAFGR